MSINISHLYLLWVASCRQNVEIVSYHGALDHIMGLQQFLLHKPVEFLLFLSPWFEYFWGGIEIFSFTFFSAFTKGLQNVLKRIGTHTAPQLLAE